MSRKITLILSLVVLGISNLSAQYKYSFSVGGDHERLNGAYGNHVRMFYNFDDNFRVNANFTRYYEVEEKNEDEAIGHDIRSLEANFNYAILFGDHLGVYAVLGFNYTFGRKATRTATDTNQIFIEKGGLNAGFGAFYKIGHFMPYIESRNISSGSNYLIFTVGIAYSFGKLSD